MKQTIIKNNMSGYESGTYLNTSNRTIMHATQTPKQLMNMIALKKLKGLHNLNNEMKPTTIIANEAIVTKTSVLIPVNI